ncbi:hypothetical protein QVD17_37192 [Tagetes erecta]|uniref:Disease resistance protein n=1 Tax=Tagetes erecta TaxID=13708 RepID=A0AAD8JW29_TARER|nr:hypothetical protein QVD17_37192 [Tagetes erecta]
MVININECSTWSSCIQQQILAQTTNPTILSVSSDEAISSYGYYELIAPNVEELTLNIVRSKTNSLPEFIKQMNQLKVLSVKGCSDYPSKFHNLSSIEGLTSLTSIRFEHVSVPSMQPILALKNLKQLTFVMCEIGDAFMSCAIDMLPNLTNLEIDMCYDVKQLPSGLCNLVQLKKLSITNCHELSVVPKGLGDLSNLEMLSLHCCTKLQELPESIGSLRKLSFIDISDCLSLSVLPEEISELCDLKVLKMNGCGGLQELPLSISELGQLEEVICDEETSYLWMNFETDLQKLKINIVEEDRLESLMKIVQ